MTTFYFLWYTGLGIRKDDNIILHLIFLFSNVTLEQNSNSQTLWNCVSLGFFKSWCHFLTFISRKSVKNNTFFQNFKTKINIFFKLFNVVFIMLTITNDKVKKWFQASCPRTFGINKFFKKILKSYSGTLIGKWMTS